MTRTLLKTDSPGWFLEVTADGLKDKRVRSKNGDNVFDSLPEAQEAVAVLSKVNSGNGADPAKAKAERPKAEPKEQEVTITEDGTRLVGKTTTIRCQWKGENGDSGKRCENTRTIKVQDAFQVKFCKPHAKKHRLKVRAAKQHQKVEARKAQKAKGEKPRRAAV